MTTILEPASIARKRFVTGELQAGLGFAARAIEDLAADLASARTFHADAEDCYATALNLMRYESAESWQSELRAMVDELRRRLDVLRATDLDLSAAA